MKIFSLAIFVFICVNSLASPLRRQWNYNRRSLPLTHKLMYVQYVQPRQSSSSIGAFSGGNVLGTQSYVKDDLSSSSVAVAYPDQSSEELPNNYDVVNNDYVPQSYQPNSPKFHPSDNGENVPNVEDDFNQSQSTVSYDNNGYKTEISSVTPKAPELPKKRQQFDTDSNVDNEGNTGYVNYRQTQRKQNPPPSQMGTYFPVYFGESSGSAIAIANSFSTGEGGSATSHAIAYGSPKSKSRLSKINSRAVPNEPNQPNQQSK